MGVIQRKVAMTIVIIVLQKDKKDLVPFTSNSVQSLSFYRYTPKRFWKQPHHNTQPAQPGCMATTIIIATPAHSPQHTAENYIS